MRPRVCSACTAALGVEKRHKASRLCSQVQTEHRRERNPARRQYDAARKRAAYVKRGGSDVAS